MSNLTDQTLELLKGAPDVCVIMNTIAGVDDVKKQLKDYFKDNYDEKFANITDANLIVHATNILSDENKLLVLFNSNGLNLNSLKEQFK